MTQEEAGVYMLGGVWRASSPLSGLCSDPAAKSSAMSSSLPIDAVAMRVLSVSSIGDGGRGAAAVRLRGEWSMKAGRFAERRWVRGESASNASVFRRRDKARRRRGFRGKDWEIVIQSVIYWFWETQFPVTVWKGGRCICVASFMFCVTLCWGG